MFATGMKSLSAILVVQSFLCDTSIRYNTINYTNRAMFATGIKSLSAILVARSSV